MWKSPQQTAVAQPHLRKEQGSVKSGMNPGRPTARGAGSAPRTCRPEPKRGVSRNERGGCTGGRRGPLQRVPRPRPFATRPSSTPRWHSESLANGPFDRGLVAGLHGSGCNGLLHPAYSSHGWSVHRSALPNRRSWRRVATDGASLHRALRADRDSSGQPLFAHAVVSVAFLLQTPSITVPRRRDHGALRHPFGRKLNLSLIHI